ncbi:ketopantoate reductase family protein [Planctomonas deserti]|uniref:ketopantoate reductase family protein n=1 Tax=Planctomonas deserti TaxID=2144185 RepID=UPI000D38BA99|nr:2-dehydropantoate 2-reductase N-terminal domain-containing protein [Planctomonas deserti]
MRYVLIGAGAIGGTLGARLAQRSQDHPPLLVARGRNGEALAEHGIRLRTPDEDVTVPVLVATSPDDVRLTTDDVLVFTTKTHQVEAALLQWVDRPVHDAASGAELGTAGDRLPVFLALNGVASERIASRYFARVFGVCVWLPAVHLVPGEVVLRIAPTSGVFVIGRHAFPADPADRALLKTLADDWAAASFVVHVVDDVLRWKHAKLLSNLGNGLQALLGTDGRRYAHLADRLRAEAEDVYRAAGIEWASPEEEEAWRGDLLNTRPVPGVSRDQLGGSSWQSVARGSGSIETDYLNGEIALLARSLGRRAPENETVQRLARQAAAAGRSAGALSVEELERELDRAVAAVAAPTTSTAAAAVSP